MSSSKEDTYWHNRGQEDVSNDAWTSTYIHGDDARQSYNEGYHHAKGQRDANEGRYSGWATDHEYIDNYNSGYDSARTSGSGK